MISAQKKSAVVRAGIVAKQLAKPSVYLCADLIEPHGVNFDDVRSHALTDTGEELYMLGRYYESLLMPHAEHHLHRLRMPFHSVQVDGLMRNGRINVGIWLTRKELEMTLPRDYERALNDISIIEVLDQPNPEQVAKDIGEKAVTYFEFAAALGIGIPNLLKIAYQISFGKIIPDLGPRGYMMLPPAVFEYYAGKQVPKEYSDFFAKPFRKR